MSADRLVFSLPLRRRVATTMDTRRAVALAVFRAATLALTLARRLRERLSV